MLGFIDSILLPFQSQFYLLPTIAMAEVVPVSDYRRLEGIPLCLGALSWRGFDLPVMTINLLTSSSISFTKVAIINALFSNERWPPYYAIGFDGRPKRIKIKEQ